MHTIIFNDITHRNEKENISNKDKVEDLELDNTDGLIDVLSGVVKQIINLINYDIDQLDKSPKTKRVLKIIKLILNFFNVFKKNKEQKTPSYSENGVSR